jgi:hypothetical protein
MKKTIGITIIAAILAVGSAFANKASRATLWRLRTGEYVTMTYAQMKQVYCQGIDQAMCAVDAGNEYNIIYRP